MLKNKYFSYLIIGVLMAGIFVLITNIQLVFQKNHNFHFDPAFYQYKNTITYLHFKENGFIETIGFILTHVRNNPLYHIVLLTIKPNLLSLPNGHLLLNFLIYSLFIFLVYEYTRFLGFTFFVRILIITMIIFLPGNFSHLHGIGSYYLDYPGGMLFSSSLILLFIWSKKKKRHLLIISMFLLGLSILVKYMIIVYVVLFYCPVLAFFIYKNRIYSYKDFLFGLLAFLIVSSFSLIYHIPGFVKHYTEMAYATNMGVLSSAKYFFIILMEFFTGIGLKILIGYFIILFAIIRMRVYPFKEAIPYLYLLIAFPLFFIFVIQTAQARHSILFFVPTLIISIISLVSLAEFSRINVKLKKIFNGLFVLLFVFFSINYISLIHKRVKEFDEEKNTTELIANEIKTHYYDGFTWDSFVDENSLLINLHVFYHHGILPDFLGSKLFSIHKTYLLTNYREEDPYKIAEIAITTIDNLHDMVLVYENIENEKLLLNNANSNIIAQKVSTHVSLSDNWIKHKVISSKKYGQIAVYFRNGKNALD